MNQPFRNKTFVLMKFVDSAISGKFQSTFVFFKFKFIISNVFLCIRDVSDRLFAIPKVHTKTLFLNAKKQTMYGKTYEWKSD